MPRKADRRALHTRRYAKQVPEHHIQIDVKFLKKLAEWERFYNFDRPHGAFAGRTPYEALRSMLK